MSYYILPKNNNLINLSPQCSDEMCKPYISYSLLNYYLKIKEQIEDMFLYDSDLSDNTFETVSKIINPYEFIYSNVPGSKFSVSKLKYKSNVFYDLIEIVNNFNIFDNLIISKSMNFLHISPNYNDSIECFEIFREGSSDNHINISFDNDNFSIQNKIDFLFCELDSSDYFTSFIQTVMIILSSQNYNGISIIKIGDVFYKPIIDMLYFLSSLYEKVYICKPSTNNIIYFDRYIVCKNFLHDERSNVYLKLNYLKLLVFIKKLEYNKNIVSILNFDVPCYFKNKLDDINNIIGQQQLESLDQIFSVYKNKNKDEKIETIKKNNIQKSVLWCEKYKIPCNKFSEKINIFLPIINDGI